MSGWTCGACTLENTAAATKCEVCETERPQEVEAEDEDEEVSEFEKKRRERIAENKKMLMQLGDNPTDPRALCSVLCHTPPRSQNCWDVES